MKKIVPLLMVFILLAFVQSYGQKKMKSPPASATGTIDGVDIRVDYHQPSARGRKIMDGLVPFDKVWRTGANEATKITFSDDVRVEGEVLAKGTYSLWTIPGADEWTIIFNSKYENVWGTNYPKGNDVLRVMAETGKTDDFVETFDISIDGNDLIFSWENTEVRMAISK